MGADRLMEGFDRLEIEALFRLRGLSPDEQRETFDDLIAMEREVRTVLTEQREQRESERKNKDDYKPLGRGKTLQSVMN